MIISIMNTIEIMANLGKAGVATEIPTSMSFCMVLVTTLVMMVMVMVISDH